jgi:hypothetical protein
LLNRTYFVLQKPDLLTCYGHVEWQKNGAVQVSSGLQRCMLRV